MQETVFNRIPSMLSRLDLPSPIRLVEGKVWGRVIPPVPQEPLLKQEFLPAVVVATLRSLLHRDVFVAVIV